MMNEEEFLKFKEGQSVRNRKLDRYENFIKKRLKEFPDASAAQVHDWLKEHQVAAGINTGNQKRI